MDRQIIWEQARNYDSFYLYEEKGIREHVRRLKKDFPGLEFLYSVKANPNPYVRRCVFGEGFGADAASLAEVRYAQEAGISPDRIQYSAPGKSGRDIEGALGAATLIADSAEEVERIQEAAKKKGLVAEIGLRVNPDFGFYGGRGVSSKFGIDEAQIYERIERWKGLSNIRIVGLHVHLHSQELDRDRLAEYHRNVLALADTFQKKTGEDLAFVNLGSGIGVAYCPGEDPVDTEALGRETAKLAAQMKERWPKLRIFLETGRYAACESGIYVTKVLDKKVSYGKTYVILSNTLNGFMRPSMAQMFLGCRPDGEVPANEPFFTGKDAFAFRTLCREEPDGTETVTLVGNLCTAADLVEKDICLPKLAPGDLVIMTNAGSYAAVITPMQFASQVPPAQLFLAEDGRVLAE